MKRLDTHIRSLDGSLQERPEIFHAIRVNVAINVGFGVVNYLVGVFRIKPIVRLQRIGINIRPKLAHVREFFLSAFLHAYYEPCRR